ncbi:hypothetical protein AMS66_17320 [Paenibacillus xylanivorans]|uniref:Uncharacterized protein n=1 Tax=Paenibacillus xylanivorans TaxID=1705561 RepID=A0A0N0C464_9BACL|nr:hypothetical protein AMS66_17320 [Paenibacillus xylanivorans]
MFVWFEIKSNRISRMAVSGCLDSPKLNMFSNVTYSNLPSNQLLNQIEGPIQAAWNEGKIFIRSGRLIAKVPGACMKSNPEI